MAHISYTSCYKELDCGNNSSQCCIFVIILEINVGFSKSICMLYQFRVFTIAYTVRGDLPHPKEKSFLVCQTLISISWYKDKHISGLNRHCIHRLNNTPALGEPEDTDRQLIHPSLSSRIYWQPLMWLRKAKIYHWIRREYAQYSTLWDLNA